VSVSVFGSKQVHAHTIAVQIYEKINFYSGSGGGFSIRNPPVRRVRAVREPIRL
jgi:hypothetical protein